MTLVAIHTGMRFSEQIRLKWDEVDFKQRLLTIRDSKPEKSRPVTLNEIAFEILKEIPQIIGCPFVFYTEKGTQRMLMARQRPGWLKAGGSRKPSLARLAPYLRKPFGDARC